MKSLKFARLVVASRCLLLGAYVLAFQPAASYHLLKIVSLGAEEGGGEYFDYISFDAAACRVYLSHGTEVKVVEADSGAVLGNITGLKRDHGVALVPELGRGFISDGDAGQVVIFVVQLSPAASCLAQGVALTRRPYVFLCGQRRAQPSGKRRDRNRAGMFSAQYHP